MRNDAPASYRAILRRVGVLLIIIGVLDVGYMIYCIRNGESYSSGLNIFAILAGMFLIRGHLGAAGLVTWLSAFFAAALVAVLILLPLLQPLDLTLAQLRSDALSMIVWLAGAVVVGFVLIWIYRQLRLPAVVEARVAAGRSGSPPKGAFILGAMLMMTFATALQLTLHGESASKAIKLAEAQVGPGYKLHVTGLYWWADRVRADVTAYTPNEIKSVEVEWSR